MNNEEFNSFKRVDENHLLDIYIGIDNLSRSTLFYISDTQPINLTSSPIINVSIGKRKDNKWGISFTLLNESYNDVFNCFCNDIIESSRSIKLKEMGASFICDRYIKWQKMLSKSNASLLSEFEIKGLIGEIIFLKEFLIPKYGQRESIYSWIGPEKTDQDFIYQNTWFEVKTTDSGSDNINISSIEQLDTVAEGELIIVYLDKTSKSDKTLITINSIYKEVLQLLDSDELKNKFTGILLGFNFFTRPEYDDLTFKFSKFDRYQVDDTFPSLRRKNLPSAIVNSKYEISVNSINKYLVTE